MGISQMQGVQLPMEFALGDRYHPVDFDLPDRSWSLDGVDHIPELMALGHESAEAHFSRIEEQFLVGPAMPTCPTRKRGRFKRSHDGIYQSESAERTSPPEIELIEDPDRLVDVVLDEPDRAVALHHVDAAGVEAPRGGRVAGTMTAHAHPVVKGTHGPPGRPHSRPRMSLPARSPHSGTPRS